MPRTQFTRAEADALLGRAARLQTEAEHTRAHAPLSLDDLKAAAAAAGIDPAFVELAAHTPTVAAPPPLLRLPAGVARSRVVRGSLTPEAWSHLVSELRNTLGGRGRIEAGPYRYGWFRAPLSIMAEPHGDLVQLTARADWGGELRGWGTLAAALVFTLGAAFGRPFGAPAALVAGLVAAFLLVPLLLRPRFRAKEKRVGAKFDAALERVAAALEATADQGHGARHDDGATVSPSTPTPVVPLPTDEPPTGAPAPGARRVHA